MGFFFTSQTASVSCELLIIAYDLFSGFQQLCYCWRVETFGGEPDRNPEFWIQTLYWSRGGGNLTYRFICLWLQVINVRRSSDAAANGDVLLAF